MRVGIYLGRHAGGGGGIAVYARALVRGILRQLEEQFDKHTEVVLYGDSSLFDQELLDDIEMSPVLSVQIGAEILWSTKRYFRTLPNGARSVLLIRMLPKCISRYGAVLWDQFLLPFVLWRDGLDVLHSVANYGLVFSPKVQMLTVHDLYQAFPLEEAPVEESAGKALGQGGKKIKRRTKLFSYFYRLLFWLQFKKKAQLVCDSTQVAKEIHERYDYPLERIKVIRLGLDQVFSRFSAERKAKKQIKPELLERFEEHGLGFGYVLVLASSDPRKNLKKTLKSWALLPEKLRSRKLVIKVLDDRAASHVKKILGKKVLKGGNIEVVQWLEREQMPLLYQRAEVVHVPTLAEGFGLVPLEALACGSKVVCGALECVAADCSIDEAVFECDPGSEESIVQALEAALTQGKANQASADTWVPRTMKMALDETFSMYQEVALRG